MNKPLIVVDVDETLVSWVNPFLKYTEKVGYTINESNKQTTYDMTSWFNPHKDWGELTRDDLVGLIEEFNDYPRALPPLKYSIPTLKSIAKQYDVIALSSFGGSPESREFRKDYLNVLYNGVFKDIILIPLGACKKDHLAKLKPEWLIEDSKQHTTSAGELGIKSILLSSSYNQGCIYSKYANHWLDISDILIPL